MPGTRRTRKGQTGRKKGSEAPSGEVWDKESLLEFDGRKNTNAGSQGKEPGGRWSPAYYETPAVVISKYNIRKP